MNNSELIETLRSQEDLERTEGERGVKNLCRFVSMMGYKDSMHFGQFAVGRNTACYGDLINFLEDNSGAIDALYDWIADNLDDEYRENLTNELTEENYIMLTDEEE